MSIRRTYFKFFFVFFCAFLFCPLYCSTAGATTANTERALTDDLGSILRVGGLPPNLITFQISPAAIKQSLVSVICAGGQINLWVQGPDSENVSAFYFGLHKLGFLFPHPRIQISPTIQNVRSHCGQKFTWVPSLPHRGFHFHTEHPNEWVSGFFQGQTRIAKDTVLWLARNFQNVMQIELLRGTEKKFAEDNKPIIQLAHDLNIEVGLGVSLAMFQQKSYHLLPFWSALTTFKSDQILDTQITKLANDIDFDYLSVGLGFTEFTPTWYGKTIEWLNRISDDLKQRHKFLMAKVHASTNQYDDTYGNFNYLPGRCNADVGIMPHTVMFYGLLDENAPVYGRKNFQDMDRFMADQSARRKTWYFPETSYFIGMDIDVPLFLTDYLRARAQDYKHIVDLGVNGIVDFTSGQELGYWLFDWNLALQADHEYLGDELAGLRLLGENLDVWRKILDFQTEYFKKKQLITTLSTSNLYDELPFTSPIHQRVLLRDLFHKESFLDYEISTLQDALKVSPLTQDIKSLELRRMLQVTQLRLQHALDLREAIEYRQDPKLKLYWLNHARHVRESAQSIMTLLMQYHSRYPDSFVFSEAANPTSYKYGYGWIAARLYYWEREENIVDKQIRNPFFMNLYNPFRLLF